MTTIQLQEVSSLTELHPQALPVDTKEGVILESIQALFPTVAIKAIPNGITVGRQRFAFPFMNSDFYEACCGIRDSLRSA